ncbi:MAG: coproporphyrinogen III oxidase [Candidatus Pedobacter colombiensis]|uniref:Coproporphyrinogen III oxidase n=1 Tax=Candidatus Pedobacter colombiensis TaxID=3121371 RepID=A0AAJ6B8K8_9SPHI|nr:coproporphyrinogen III oxidase [Pedobacter sp.]WEK21465.1 MAG: coproporphyrinogen III oxidase [Pedobacter sp.]
MRKLFLSFAIAIFLGLAISACNSTKSVSGDSDSLKVDTNITPAVDTTNMTDTMKTMPDTTTMPPAH